ncbi:hypothetical protein ABZ584_27875 [Streptomyces antibioticus]|uniref:hypothetical protein n=1 Tax=Streptomyces antibioticus TaxID=1890 RepID=UPI0033F40014
MDIKHTYLRLVFNLWFLITPPTLIGYYFPWVSGTRIPGRRFGQVPLLKGFGRRTAEKRLDAITDSFNSRLDAHSDLEVWARKFLVDQVQAHATWARLSRLFLAAPGMLATVALALVVSPLTWRTSSLWAICVYLTFVYVSATLTCIDIWAVRNADSAGAVSVAAVGVAESFTTRAGKGPAKLTPVVWQSELIEQLCTALVRRAYRQSAKAVPGSRITMMQETATVVRALRYRAALVHAHAEGEERQAHERELFLLISNIVKYSSRPRAQIIDFRVIDTDRLGHVPDAVPDVTDIPSSKALVLVPLLFVCVLVAVSVALGMTGAAGEITQPIVIGLALAGIPLIRPFGVTVLDAFMQPSASASRQADPLPMPEPAQ